MALLEAEGPELPPGTRPGESAVLREGVAAVLLTAGPLVLTVASLLFGSKQAGLAGAGEAVREQGVGVRDCEGVVAADLGVGVAALEAVFARFTASRRRREAEEPGQRCARRERWLAPNGGRVSLEVADCTGAVIGRSTGTKVGEVLGLEGLGHLEDGSGQTGLLG